MDETPRERELHRALLIIEGLASLHADDGPLGEIYSIAHAASGLCCKGGLGDPWVQETDAYEAELKAAGIMDVQKILESNL